MRLIIITAVTALGEASNVPISDWMSELDDSIEIRNIPIIPGTHNSGTARAGAFYFGAYQVARQQKLSIADQLLAGVRVLDIRLRFKEGTIFGCFQPPEPTMHVVHTFDTCYTLESLLKEVSDFLHSHKSEFIVSMIRGDWPPTWSFASTDALKVERVKELSAVLRHSGIGWAENVNIDTTIGPVRGKAILLSDWFEVAPAKLEVPHLTKWRAYAVCDIWDENPGENPALKVDRFMQSTSVFNMGLKENTPDKLDDARKKRPRVCEDLPGSKLLTGVALDRTHGYIVPPILTSWNWNRWFVENLEKNPRWRPQMHPPVPVGVVLIDFADMEINKRLLDVGFRMMGKDITVDITV